MLGITGAFSSLGINEHPRRSSENGQKPRTFPKTHSTTSLPNMFLTERPTISPKFMRNLHLETEQPVDFSKKYCETKPDTYTFTMYAETDLDQPTDYSLRYAEDDSELVKPETTEFVQDTIKTYCTEDTPYETPFNFSTSTSLSDLRIDDKKSDKDVVEANAKEKVKSEFSSGLMSPEKPVKYCEEGTPGYFSRVPSCGSLNSELPPIKQEIKEEENVKRKNKFEPKAVKFEDVVNYAEETPLMFSRSSSLASLDSIEQHSIHDDRSSVVSDFSRLTSGVISPSELPDSPSQTVPPSPKPRKNDMIFPEKKDEKIVPKSGVFEDVVKKFKVESTPVLFSSATSLSSLTDDCKKEEVKGQDLDNLSENSDEEDILAACINIGMQNNRYSQSKVNGANLTKSKDDLLEKNDVTSDSLRTYCTEGTPAVLSHAGSNSNLSILSMHVLEKLNDADSDELHKSESGNFESGHEEQALEDQAVPSGDLEEVANCSNQSRRSSFSSLSDDSHESEQALLEECMLAGMPKSTSPTKSSITFTPNIVEETKDLMKHIKETVDSDSDDDDANILDNCIKIGIENNRYTQKNKCSAFNKPQKQDVIGDSVKSYCTEDTPAILSHAGSCSNLSALEDDEPNYLSDLSDEDEENLLEECLKYGMASISERAKCDIAESTQKHETGSISSLSDASYEADQALLQQCIQAGMPKRLKPFQDDSGELTPAEKALLQQCILDGMKKCRSVPKKSEDSELTEAEQALLRQCILSGMPKNKNLAIGGPSVSRESTELSESERLLLQQCIIAGMPKNRRGNKEKVQLAAKKSKEVEHTCCVHCPRNNRAKQNGHVKSRRKYRERVQVQGNSREVSVLYEYVTGQILTVKKEVVDRKYEKWV